MTKHCVLLMTTTETTVPFDQAIIDMDILYTEIDELFTAWNSKLADNLCYSDCLEQFKNFRDLELKLMSILQRIQNHPVIMEFFVPPEDEHPPPGIKTLYHMIELLSKELLGLSTPKWYKLTQEYSDIKSTDTVYVKDDKGGHVVNYRNKEREEETINALVNHNSVIITGLYMRYSTFMSAFINVIRKTNLQDIQAHLERNFHHRRDSYM